MSNEKKYRRRRWGSWDDWARDPTTWAPNMCNIVCSAGMGHGVDLASLEATHSGAKRQPKGFAATSFRVDGLPLVSIFPGGAATLTGCRSADQAALAADVARDAVRYVPAPVRPAEGDLGDDGWRPSSKRAGRDHGPRLCAPPHWWARHCCARSGRAARVRVFNVKSDSHMSRMRGIDLDALAAAYSDRVRWEPGEFTGASMLVPAGGCYPWADINAFVFATGSVSMKGVVEARRRTLAFRRVLQVLEPFATTMVATDSAVRSRDRRRKRLAVTQEAAARLRAAAAAREGEDRPEDDCDAGLALDMDEVLGMLGADAGAESEEENDGK